MSRPRTRSPWTSDADDSDPTDRSLAPAETDAVILPATISPLNRERTIALQRLRRAAEPGDAKQLRARTDADDRAVRGVLERLNVHRGRGRPLEISERDAVLAGDRDAQQEGGGARGGTAWRRSGGRERCRSDEGCDDRDGEADHGESG
jgi:hypothetical protein